MCKWVKEIRFRITIYLYRMAYLWGCSGGRGEQEGGGPQVGALPVAAGGNVSCVGWAEEARQKEA